MPDAPPTDSVVNLYQWITGVLVFWGGATTILLLKTQAALLTQQSATLVARFEADKRTAEVLEKLATAIHARRER